MSTDPTSEPEWIIRGERLKTRRRSSGGADEVAHDYQRAWALGRLVEMLDDDNPIVALRYEGSQDVDVMYTDGRQEHVQLKSGIEQRVTIKALASAFEGFALDFVDGHADDLARSHLLSFRLILRVMSEGAAIGRIRRHQATVADIAAVARTIESVLRDKPGVPEPKAIAAEIVRRLAIERGRGSLEDQVWSFELSADRSLQAKGISSLRVPDARRALRDELKPRASVTRATAKKVVQPYLDASPNTPPTAPAPPWSYEERRGLLNALRTATTGGTPGRPIAIHGMGGSGKTILTLALAADKEVRATFPDGTLWTSLGQEPDVAEALQSFVVTLGGNPPAGASAETLAAIVRQQLNGRRYLIVLDDVWSVKDAELVNVGNPSCRIVLSTRDASVAAAVGAAVVAVGGMEEREALRLFAREADLELDSEDLMRPFLTRVEHLPLAIHLGAAQVRLGRRLDELLEDLSAEIARLDSLDADRGSEGREQITQDRRSVSLEACFALSIRRLDDSLRRAFDRLGLLREGAEITPTCARILLESNTDREAIDTLRLLAIRALLAEPSSRSTFRMHDLLRDYARRRLAADGEPGPGVVFAASRIRTENVRFLDRCKEVCSAGRWSALPADTYLTRQVIWHAMQAERPEIVHEVLEDRDDAGYAWIARRMREGELAELVDDLEAGVALTNTDMATIDLQAAEGLPRLAQYGLLHACIREHGTWTPAPLVVRMVEAGFWTPERALSYARTSTEASLKIWTMASLSAHFGSRWDGALGEEAVNSAIPVDRRAVFTMPEAAERLVSSLSDRLRMLLLSICVRKGVLAHALGLETLGRYAPQCVSSEALRAFEEQLANAKVSPVEATCLRARAVGAGLPISGGIDEILSEWKAYQFNASDTFSIAGALFPVLSDVQQIEAIQLLHIASNQGLFLGFLRQHASCLSDGSVHAALRETHSIQDGPYKGWIIGLLAARLRGSDAERARSEAFRLLRTGIGSPDQQFKAFTDVGAALDGRDAVDLERDGIRAGVSVGLGNFGGMLGDYACRASAEALQYLTERILSGNDWDRVEGLPGILAVASDDDVERLTVSLVTAMERTRRYADLFPCYRRLPSSMLADMVAAGRPAGPRVAAYQALAALAWDADPHVLLSIADEARADCEQLSQAERLQIAAAFAADASVYLAGTGERLGDDLAAAFELSSTRIGHEDVDPADVRAVLEAAPESDCQRALATVTERLDRLPDYRVERLVRSMGDRLSAEALNQLRRHAERLGPPWRAPALAALSAVPSSAHQDIGARPSSPDAEFHALFREVHQTSRPASRQISVASAYWDSLSATDRRAELRRLFDPAEGLSSRAFLNRLRNIAFALNNSLDALGRADLIAAIRRIMRQLG
jgi:NB-ARC domain-containing protein/Cap4-like dsDNA endonuclease family protein